MALTEVAIGTLAAAAVVAPVVAAAAAVAAAGAMAATGAEGGTVEGSKEVGAGGTTTAAKGAGGGMECVVEPATGATVAGGGGSEGDGGTCRSDTDAAPCKLALLATSVYPVLRSRLTLSSLDTACAGARVATGACSTAMADCPSPAASSPRPREAVDVSLTAAAVAAATSGVGDSPELPRAGADAAGAWASSTKPGGRLNVLSFVFCRDARTTPDTRMVPHTQTASSARIACHQRHPAV